jgi:hypothetical protein
VRLTKRNVRKPGCTRIASAGTLRVAGRAGMNRVRFDGRLPASRRLTPGRYTVTFVAADASGHRSEAHSLRFRIATREGRISRSALLPWRRQNVWAAKRASPNAALSSYQLGRLRWRRNKPAAGASGCDARRSATSRRPMISITRASTRAWA